MFARLGNIVTGHPWRVIAAWIATALVLASIAPGLKTTSDQSSFLPNHYESVRAQKLADRAFPQTSGLTAVTVLTRRDSHSLTSADRARVQALAAGLAHARIDGTTRVQAPGGAISRDGRVQLVETSFARGVSGPRITHVVEHLRGRIGAMLRGSGLKAQTGGAPAQFADLDHASSKADSIVAVATIALILLLLLAIFRSPVAALVPILTVAVVSIAATALIALAANGLGLKADSSITSLLTIVLFGIGTDYTLFLLFRVRERLRAGDDARVAVAHAVARVGVTVASSATVVAAAVLALGASQLESNRVLGPSLAIAVLVMLVAALTLVPAVLALLGPRVFWPSSGWRRERSGGVAAAVAGFVSRRPVLALAASTLVLGALAFSALGMKSDYNLTGDLPASAESQQAQAALTAAFPNLTATPTSILVRGARPTRTAKLARELELVPGVKGVSRPESGRTGAVERLSVYLASDSAFSAQSLHAVADEIRPVTRSLTDATALVGGPTATVVDARSAMQHDFRLIFPLAALIIAVVLALVLRSLVAPWILLGAVGLGFAATIGLTTLVFQSVGGDPGIAFSLPLTMYVFVVAVGTDYNILVATRMREEQERTGYTREGVRSALRATPPTVASAAVILAGTFGSLMLTSLGSLQQLGFGVSAGILLGALVMASVLVPGAAAALGRRFWWPGSRCSITSWSGERKPGVTERTREQRARPRTQESPPAAATGVR